MPASNNNESKYIKEVWAENLEEEMSVLRDLVEQYPFLAMVEFTSLFFITFIFNNKKMIFFLF